MYKIPANTLFLGKNLLFMPECHSTNSFALELCQQNSPPAEGTIIITINQTSGRGQRGNVWLAEPGKNLTFSIILRPTFLSITDQFYLNIMTALAVCDYLMDNNCSNVHVKWPNDVYAGDQKICGILVENQLMGNQISTSIVGIGLNINQQSFPIPSATSVALQVGREFNLSHELELLLHVIESRYLQLRRRDHSKLMRDYLDHLYWFNEEHTFESESLGKFKGVISGLDNSGKLIIHTNGKDKLFGMKEVSYLQ